MKSHETRSGTRVGFVSAFALGSLALVTPAAGSSVHRYVDWTSVDAGKGTASGTITLPDATKITVRFTARNADGTPGQLFGAQVDEGGTNYWQPAAPYISAEVENAPPGTDIVQLAGSDDQVYELTLSAPVENPVLAIVSLGAPGIVTTYHFGSPFVIVSQGAGALGGSDQALVRLPGNVLEGNEGHGTIRFEGRFTSLSWTVPTTEVWHGFTLGVRTGERPAPPADAGSPSGAADGGASDVAVGPTEVDPPAGGAGGRSGTGSGGEPGRVDAASSPQPGPSGGCNVTGSGSPGGAWLVALAAFAGLVRRRVECSACLTFCFGAPK